MNNLLLAIVFVLFASCASTPTKELTHLEGKTHFEENINIPLNKSKATVVVFLSATCPCSNSHVELLSKMNKKYKDVQFLGVHSNSNEKLKTAQKYFKSKKTSFPILWDKETTLAKKLGAVKTPHAYILNRDGKVIYQGGVTSSSNAKIAKENFLELALNDIENGNEPSIKERKTLGCYIPLKDD